MPSHSALLFNVFAPLVLLIFSMLILLQAMYANTAVGGAIKSASKAMEAMNKVTMSVYFSFNSVLAFTAL